MWRFQRIKYKVIQYFVIPKNVIACRVMSKNFLKIGYQDENIVLFFLQLAENVEYGIYTF